MYKPCVVVPVFNHHHKIRSVLDKIVSMGYMCFLVDDGSDEYCSQKLRSLAAENEKIDLIRLETNQGKGVAVCIGLGRAHNEGYTHAMQVDADGQHNLEDIKKFLEASELNPLNVVTAVRTCESSPRSRSYGRAITNFWVWINTLSFQIKDSMCGFRVYPLKSTIQLLGSVSVGKRMNFDTDILVRLYWSGIDITQITTNIVYLNDVPSHFRLIGDNIRISLMHARLFFGMIIRIPKLINRNLRGNSYRVE